MPMTDELSFGLPEALTADVVVVGAGASGMVAALSAAESGDSVILLEKSLKMGGAMLTVPGIISINQLELMTTIFYDRLDRDFTTLVDHHYCDSPELDFFSSRYRQAKNPDLENNLELIKVFEANIDSTCDWLKKMGVILDGLPLPDEYPGSENLISFPDASTLFRCVADQLKKHDVRVITDARAIGLLMNGDRVHGVEVDFMYSRRDLDNLDVVGVRATKGVVLATGDFSGNDSLKTRYLDPVAAMARGRESANTGDGHIMGQQLKVPILNPGLVWGPRLCFKAPGPVPDPVTSNKTWISRLSQLGLGGLTKKKRQRGYLGRVIHLMNPRLEIIRYGALLCDDKGELVTDPSARGLSGDHPDREYWMVFNSSIAQRLRENNCPIGEIPALMHGTLDDYIRLDTNQLLVARSPEELADQTDLRAHHLQVLFDTMASSLNANHGHSDR